MIVLFSDISQMLVNNVMKSGPAYRRRPHPSKLLSPIGKLRFEKSAEVTSNLICNFHIYTFLIKSWL